MTHGGARPRAGRPLRGGAPSMHRPACWLTEAEWAELTDGLRDGERVADLLRDGALALVRARRIER